jgi:choline dehydrogenase
MNPKGRTRSYAATAYYLPAAKRPNLKVTTGALVGKVLTKRSSEGNVHTIGVQYTIGKTVFQARASKEVVLSAGSIGSPQILELSGIGNPAVLNKHGIKVDVENQNVGENLQDHVYVPIA